MAEDRRQRAEDRGQRTEGRRQRAEGREKNLEGGMRNVEWFRDSIDTASVILEHGLCELSPCHDIREILGEQQGLRVFR